MANNPEIYWLTLTAIVTGLMWLPYILQIILHRGLNSALWDANGVVPSSPWSERAKKAHANAVENLVIFAALVLSVQVLGKATEATAMAGMIYFIARMVHYVVYVLGLPYLRTVTFAAGVACQAVLAIALLS